MIVCSVHLGVTPRVHWTISLHIYREGRRAKNLFISVHHFFSLLVRHLSLSFFVVVSIVRIVSDPVQGLSPYISFAKMSRK
jgi:hypothetical protein